MEQEEVILKEATLIYLVSDNKILLPKKARKIGMGRRNGYGGGVEKGENLIQCAIRELEEEAGIKSNPEDLEKVAELRFKNTNSDGTNWEIVVHTYFAKKWEGEVRETEDGAMTDPKWFSFTEIPFHEMMDADREWLPQVLSGKKLIVRTHYGPFQKELLEPITIEEVTAFGE